MAEVIYLSERGPLSKEEKFQYEIALGKVNRGKAERSVSMRNLESTFKDMENLLKVLSGGEDHRDKFFVNKYSEAELVTGIGVVSIKKYLLETEEICNKIKDWGNTEINQRFSEEMEIVKKYEYRYNKYNRE